MKKLLFILLGILAFTSCSKSRYAELVPADADMVISFNVKDMLDGCGAEGNIDEIFQELEKFAPVAVPKSIKDILSEPRKLGLRLDKDAYLWFEKDGQEGGMVMGMHDKDDFEKSVKKMAGDLGFDVQFRKEDKYVVMEVNDGSQNDNAIIILNDDYLLFAASDKRKAEEAATFWTKQEKDEQYIRTKRFEHLSNVNGQLKIDVSPSIALSTEEWRQMLKEAKQEDLDVSPEEMGCILSGYFKKGGIVATAEVYCLNDKLNEKLDDAKKRARNIKGDLAQFVPQNYVCWMGTNVNMPEVLNDNSFQEAMKMAEENGINGIGMLSYLDGEMQCYITPDQHITFNAQLGSEYDESKADKELQQFPQIEKTGKGDYAITQQMYNWFTETTTKREIAWMSTKDRMLTISNDEQNLNAKCNAGNTFGDLESEIKKSVAALVVNKSGLKEFCGPFGELIDYFASFCITVNKDMQVKVALKFSHDWTLFELVRNMQKDGAITRALMLGALQGNRRSSNSGYIDYNDNSTANGDFSYDDSEFDSWE